MRALLASSIGVACTAALALPFALPAGATAAHPQRAARPSPVPGSTQSLPLGPLGSSDRARAAVPQGAAAAGLVARDVNPFSLVGIVWDDATTVFHGRAQVRTKDAGTHKWSPWQDIQTHNDDVPDPGSPDRASGRARGSSAPLWVGDSVGVQVRALGEEAAGRSGHSGLPGGLRIELVDPGDDPEDEEPASEAPKGRNTLTPEESASSAVNAEFASMGATEITPLDKEETEAEASELTGSSGSAAARPYIGPRPGIVTRAGWGADEKLREREFLYTKTVKAAFVHHSATGNNYTCKQVPALLRSIYRFHVKSSGWRDFGYNFVVDKCGTIYEGRAGGVARPVMGAHTLGFNTDTMGIAVLGTYSKSNPPAAAVSGVAKLTAWKLGLFGANPRGKVTLVSGGSNKYKKGARVSMNVISGHRDGFVTECPGALLYGKLGSTRSSSAKLQGR
ncbi:peptidoglycan recognition protein [Streptomyces sp. NPDC048639]|uniref:peptidoglycan recognition protein family protein n=1 Tax=Streptomyces sp. NPDC048639 TaxID=3365581 RepID=UPI00371C16EB